MTFTAKILPRLFAKYSRAGTEKTRYDTEEVLAGAALSCRPARGSHAHFPVSLSLLPTDLSEAGKIRRRKAKGLKPILPCCGIPEIWA